MPNCQHCNTAIAEEYNFCINCENQVKCLGCGAYLGTEDKCSKCETPIIAQPKMYHLSVEEKRAKDSCSLKIDIKF